ncbi:uncharacterized protein SPAPADRAFT_152372, partial [Spathaspora passalidarum NRRL Y-27907]
FIYLFQAYTNINLPPCTFVIFCLSFWLSSVCISCEFATKSTPHLLTKKYFSVPPIPVIVKKGCTGSVFINILLWLLGGIFAIVHAVYVVGSNPHRRKHGSQTSYRHPLAQYPVQQIYVNPK